MSFEPEPSVSAEPPVGDPRKFDAGGEALSFHGNTVLFRVRQHGPSAALFAGLARIAAQAGQAAWASRVARLPPASFHMTLFDGANDHARNTTRWPADLPAELSMAGCSDALAKRLAGLSGDLGPFRFQIAAASASPHDLPLTIALEAATPADEHRLRGLRDRLADQLRLRGPDHETYRFHVTLAYTFSRLSPAEQLAFQVDIRRWHDQLRRETSVIVFDGPEFCTFEDMLEFKTMARLGGPGAV